MCMPNSTFIKVGLEYFSCLILKNNYNLTILNNCYILMILCFIHIPFSHSLATTTTNIIGRALLQQLQY